MQLEERPSRQQQRCKDTRIVHRNEQPVPTKLQRIANKASRGKRFQFNSLFHLMNEELLLAYFTQLKASAASGIDNYGKSNVNLEVKCVVEEPCA